MYRDVVSSVKGSCKLRRILDDIDTDHEMCSGLILLFQKLYKSRRGLN
jgi:hypothetical protein